MNRRDFVASLIPAAVVAQDALAQDKQAPAGSEKSIPPDKQVPAPPKDSVSVNEVIVPVTVTDEKGRFVTDLDQQDFKIYDEGKEQTIRYFSRERSQPVVVGFLVDQS